VARFGPIIADLPVSYFGSPEPYKRCIVMHNELKCRDPNFIFHCQAN
jgi:hypothetical protein